MDENQIKVLISKLSELMICKNRPQLSTEAKNIWLNKLKSKMPFKAICEGIEKLCWDNDDFPTMDKIYQYSLPTEQEKDIIANDKFDKIIVNRIKGVKFYVIPPSLKDAINAIGGEDIWNSLLDIKKNGEKFRILRQQFVKAYKSLGRKHNIFQLKCDDKLKIEGK